MLGLVLNSRRKALAFSSAALFLVAFLWLARSIFVSLRGAGERNQVGYGSSYIFKGPFAEDKVIVMARVTGENVSWVGAGLPE
jgi:hypothetical protein